MKLCRSCQKELDDFDTNHEPACRQTNWCYCEHPQVDFRDQCHGCWRPHRPSVFARYGWPE